MTYTEFKNKFNGQGVDFDGAYGVQCMDLYQRYNKDVVGAPSVPADPAYKVWAENKYPLDFYTKIENTPTGVPLQGDVVVWKPGLNGGYGHIAIFDNGNVNIFTSFDQNFQIKNAHLQSHNYNYVYGWLRPKVTKNWDQVVDRMKAALNAGGTSENRAREADKIFNS